MNIYKVATSTSLQTDDINSINDYIEKIVNISDNGIIEGEDLQAFFEERFYPIAYQIIESLNNFKSSSEEEPSESQLEEVYIEEVEDQVFGDEDLETLFDGLNLSLFLQRYEEFKSVIENYIRTVNLNNFKKDDAEATPEVEVSQRTLEPIVTPTDDEDDEGKGRLSFEDKVSESERLPFSFRVDYIVQEFSPEEIFDYLDSLSYSRPSEFGGSYPNPRKIRELIELATRAAHNYSKHRNEHNKSDLTQVLSKLLIYSFGMSIVDKDKLEEYIGKDKEQDVGVQEAIVEKKEPEEKPKAKTDSETEKLEKIQETRNRSISLNSDNVFLNNPLFSQSSDRVRERVDLQKVSGIFSSPFIDFPGGFIESLERLEETNLPRIDESALSDFVNSAKRTILAIKNVVSTSLKSKHKFNYASYKKDINNLMYSIKSSDTSTIKSINEYIKRVESFEDSQAKLLHLQRVIGLKQEFENKCASSQFLLRSGSDNMPLTLFYVCSFLQSMLTFEINYGKDGENKLKNVISKTQYSVKDEDIDSLLRHCQDSAEDEFTKKLKSFLDFNFPGNTSNFIMHSSLNFNYILNIAISKEYVKSTDYRISPCPVCFKWIPFYFGPETTQTDIGFSTILVSPFGYKDKKLIALDEANFIDKRFLITRKYQDKYKYIGLDLLSRNPDTVKRRRERQAEFNFLEDLINKDGNQGKTWVEIQDLISSSNINSQREGYHRRAAAMLEMGGVQLSGPRRMNELAVRCPSNPSLLTSKVQSDGAGSYCGLKPLPVESDVLSPRLSFQPSFSGTFRNPRIMDRRAEAVQETGWSSESSLQSAQASIRSGYKFSAVSIACPCRISDPTKQQISTHRNIVIAKSGTVGTTGVYPTTPDGSLDNTMDPSTVSFMVCASATSLSSFNRNVNDGPAFILEVLLKAKQASESEYFKFLNFLILNGLDIQDIMSLNRDLQRYIDSKIVKTTSFHELYDSSDSDLRKIAELLITAGSAMTTKSLKPLKGLGIRDESLFKDVFGNMSLICPLGHKFKIKDSLNFGEAYHALYGDISNTKYISLVTSSGGLNREAVDSLITEKPVGFVENAWESENAFKSRNFITKNIITGKLKTGTQVVETASTETEDESQFEGNALPGTELIDPDDDSRLDYYRPEQKPSRIQQRISSNFLALAEEKYPKLIEVIKKSVLMIDTYLNSAIPTSSAALVRALESSTLSFEAVKSRITSATEKGGKAYDTLIKSGVGNSPYYAGVVSANKVDEFTSIVVDKISEQMLNLFYHIYTEVGVIASISESDIFNLDIDKRVSEKILRTAIDGAIESFAVKNRSAFKGVDLDEAINSLAEVLLSGNNFMNFLFREAWELGKSEVPETLGSRLFAVSYAIYYAKLLSGLYSKYFNPNNSYDYLGFDLGVDLSRYNMLISANQNFSMYNLVSGLSSDFEDVISSQQNSFSPKVPNSQSYISRMDRFYSEILVGIKRASTAAGFPTSLIEARGYLRQRLEFELKDSKKVENVMSSFARAIPISTMKMSNNYDNDDPETISYRIAPNRSRIPIISNALRNLADLEREFTINKSWVLVPKSNQIATKRDGTKIRLPRYSASSSEEAEAIKARVIQEYAREDISVDYDILRDDYVTSKDRFIDIQIRSGKDFINPKEYSGNIPYGFVINLLVKNIRHLPFSIFYKSPQGDSIPLNISEIIGNPDLCNSYFVNAKLPDQLRSGISNLDFEVRYDVSASGEMPPLRNNYNINTSFVQIGTIRPRTKDRTFWPKLPALATSEDHEEQLDWSDDWTMTYKTKEGGFSNAWTYAGIILPIKDDDPVKNRPSVSLAGNVPVINYNVVIDYDGEPLNITPLILRGRSSYYELPNTKEKLGGDIEEIKRLEDKILLLKQELDNADSKQDEDRIIAKMRALGEKINSYAIKIDTNPAYYWMSKPELGFPRPAEGANADYIAKERYLSPTPQLVNPFHAFRIINNPEIRNVILDQDDRRKLKDFITRIYNLQPIVNFLRSLGLSLDAEDLFDQSKMHELSEVVLKKNIMPELRKGGSQNIIGVINTFIKRSGWHDESGEFFNLKVNSDFDMSDPKSGSYIQFGVSPKATTYTGAIPDIKSFINEGKSDSQIIGTSQLFNLRQVGTKLFHNSLTYLNAGELPDDDSENYALDPITYSEEGIDNVLLSDKNRGGTIDHVGAREQLLRGI